MAKYIQREPPTYKGDAGEAAKEIIDYLEYLRENLNFILNNYAKRLPTETQTVVGNAYATEAPNIVTNENG